MISSDLSLVEECMKLFWEKNTEKIKDLRNSDETLKEERKRLHSLVITSNL
jgi:hypothetical protein